MLWESKITGPYSRYYTGKPWKAVTAVFQSIKDALGRGEKVQIVGFGTFEQVRRTNKSRRFDPRTKKLIGRANVPVEYNTVVFYPSRDLKRFVKAGIKEDES